MPPFSKDNFKIFSNLLSRALQMKIKVNTFLGSCWQEVTFAVRKEAMRLTHWGRVTQICVSKQTIIGSDNGLSPGRRQAIIWTNDGILLIGPLGTNFREILIEIHTFSFKKMNLKMSSGECRPFCFGLNVLTNTTQNAMCPHLAVTLNWRLGMWFWKCNLRTQITSYVNENFSWNCS